MKKSHGKQLISLFLLYAIFKTILKKKQQTHNHLMNIVLDKPPLTDIIQRCEWNCFNATDNCMFDSVFFISREKRRRKATI